MRESKKAKVKDFARKQDKSFTINQLHRTLTGRSYGMRWHDPIFEVSKSTIRNAMDEMVSSGEFKSYYPIGHCFDEKWYKKV